MARVIQRTRAQVPTASNVRICDICGYFLQRSGGYLLRKCTIFTGKKLRCISQGVKKTYLMNKFVKILENYAPLSVFLGIMQIMRFCIRA